MQTYSKINKYKTKQKTFMNTLHTTCVQSIHKTKKEQNPTQWQHTVRIYGQSAIQGNAKQRPIPGPITNWKTRSTMAQDIKLFS